MAEGGASSSCCIGHNGRAALHSIYLTCFFCHSDQNSVVLGTHVYGLIYIHHICLWKFVVVLIHPLERVVAGAPCAANLGRVATGQDMK